MKRTSIKKGIFICIAAILGIASSFAQTITNVTVDASACTGRTVSIAFTPTGFAAGTSFTAQLSDASGAFTAPVEIGTGATSPIEGRIPSASVAGNGYKVRVITLTPVVTSSISGNVSINTTPPPPTGQNSYHYCVGDPVVKFSAIGENLKWYALNGTVLLSGAPSYSTETPVRGHIPYSVSQTVNGCESGKLDMIISGNLKGESPIVTNPGPVCQNLVVSSSILSNAIKNYNFGDFIWDDSPTIASPQTVPTPSTAEAGSRDYYVSRVSINGVTTCASPKSKVTLTVLPAPATPTVTNRNFTQNASSSPLTATGTTGVIKWYETATNTTPLPSPPIPSTATVGTRSYYVTQTIGDCESPRAKLDVVVSAAACETPAPTVASITYCLSETAVALTATGTALKWYTASTGGTALAAAPTPVITTAGTTSYYVSQTLNGCEGPRAKLDVIVNPQTPAPAVVSPINYTVGTSNAVPLTATGASLKWYTAASGGTALASAPTPSTATAGTTSYFVSQTLNGCEGPRAEIVVSVATCTTPAPAVVSPVSYATGATNAVPLTATGTALKWYTVATGGTALAAVPTPSTTTAGTTSYYVSQTLNGCEGPRAKIDVVVTTAACATAAPTVVNIAYCFSETAVALTATGTALKWYTAATGGAALASAPTPSTTTAGTTSYYVSQTLNGCEGPRAKLDVTVNPQTPAPAVVSPVSYATGATNAVPLTATGTALKWYTVATGGTALTAAPVPVTTAAGTKSYFVSQTLNGCEGARAKIDVVVSTATCTPPPAPTGQSLYILCEGATPQQLTATGQNLKWYQYVQGKGQLIGSAPTPSTAGPQTPTSPTYYVTQTINGCESSGLDVTVAVNRVAATPTITNPDSICQNSQVTSSLLTGSIKGGFLAENYRWYETSTSTTPQALPVPSTSISGAKDYFVTYWPARFCESPKAKITITVKAAPAMPKTQEYFSYCVGATATKLTAEGQNLKWYGGDGTTVLNGAPTPGTTDAHNALTPSFYVSQTINGCESIKAPISINVNAISPTPIVTNPAAICQNSEVTSQLLLSALPQNLTYTWYDADGKAYQGVPTPSSSTAGTKDYFVTQVNSRSCESLKAKVTVVVKPEPASPTISKSLVEYCQGVAAAPLTATPATNGTLNWFGTSATGGSSSTTAPTPSTETEGTTSYYVGQTLAGCSSGRAKIDVKINVTPKPTLATSFVEYCQGKTASPLSATGDNLKWYLTKDATDFRTSPLTPFTEKVEDYSFYVTQTGANTCESQKAEIKVHIKPLPSATISGSTSVLPDQSTTITINFTGDGPWSYTLSDGQTGTSANATTKVTVTPKLTTNYVVTQVSNACGAGISVGVAVVTVLIPTITTGSPSVAELCAGRSFTVPFQKSGDFPSGNAFTAQISTVNDATRFVSIPSSDNGSILTAVIPDTVKAGSYFIRVVSAGQGGTLPGGVSPTKIKINPLPVATITGPSNVLMGQNATLSVAITGDAPWTFNLNDGAKDTLISASISPVSVRISPKTTSVYQITSVSNGCGVGRGAGTFRVQVDPVLGAEPPVAAADWLKIYPTMIENKCTVEITGTISTKEAIVEIIDLNGRSLSKRAIRQKVTEVDFTSRPPGMYLLKVQNGDRASVQRIFKP